MEALAHVGEHVQVGQGRLDHEDVRALGHVQGHLLQGLPPVGRVHLVLAAVPEAGRALRCLPEGAVEAAGVLGRVAHHRHVGEARLVQPGPDGPHHAVDHARGGDDVRAGLRVDHRGPLQQLQGGVVEQVALGQGGHVVLVPGLVDDAAVAVVRVLAEAHVRDDHQLRRRCLDGPDGPGHDALRVVVLRAAGVLLLWDAEKDHPGDAQPGDLLRLLGQLVHRELVLAGHGADGVADPLAWPHEEGVDEVRWAQRRFPDHAPQVGAQAQPPGAQGQPVLLFAHARSFWK